MSVMEGAWDCPSCGRKRNRGPEKFCGACGAPRGKDVEFYLPDDARIVTDEEELKKAGAGADWNCNFCNSDNPVYNKFCSGCGASIEGDSPHRNVVDIPDKKPEQKGHYASPVKSSIPSGSVTQQKIQYPHKKGNIYIYAVFALILFITGLGYYLLSSHEELLTVKGFEWNREIKIEKFMTLTETGWEGTLPSDARIISSTRAIHHYDKVRTGTQTKTRTVSDRIKTGTRKVKSGTKNMGNGYFKTTYRTENVYKTVYRQETYQVPVYKDVPVYKTKYTYNIDRWKYYRSATAAGHDHKPYWPDFRLNTKEREGARRETYMVNFVNKKGKILTYTARTLQEWLFFHNDKSYKAMVNNLGTITQIKP